METQINQRTQRQRNRKAAHSKGLREAQRARTNERSSMYMEIKYVNSTEGEEKRKDDNME
ncbi:Hypothetical protein FKW44_008665, partial [Caligus rogercresseyi]